MIEQERLIAAPYPGLRPFETNENFIFFGRDGQSDEVLHKLNMAHFVAVVGTSGSGKSSLVRAGVLPALLSGHMAKAGSKWRIAILRPGNSPIKNLASALNAPDVFGVAGTDQAETRLSNIERTLRRSSLGLLEVVSQSRMDPGENLLLLVDQFEELFRFKQGLTGEQPEDEAAAFVKLLLEGKQSSKGDKERLPIYVILTMRSDYLGHCANFWGLPEAINEGQYLIPRMTDDDRREAITGPSIIGGGRISAPLVNRLLNDAGEDPARLPILQHALMRTWALWKRLGKLETLIDLDHYEKIGTMAHALSLHADEAFLELSPALQVVAEKVFKALTEKEADRNVRRPATVATIAASAETTEDAVKQVVESFRREGRSFLMPPPAVELKSDTLVDISHESLINGWDRLKQWVKEEAEAAWQYRRLAQAAALFPESEDYLRGPALQINLRWREQHRPTKAWAMRYDPGFDKAIAYIDESKANLEKELAEKERKRKEEIERDLRHAQEIADEQKRRVKQLRWGLLVLSILVIGLLVATIYASRQKAYAETQRSAAERARAEAVEAKNEAQKQRDEANTQKNVAVGALKEANLQKNIAVSALAEAEKQTKRAEDALATAQQQRDEARKQRKVADDAKRTAIVERGEAILANTKATAALEEQKNANAREVAARAEAEKQKKGAEAALAEIKEIDSSAPYYQSIMRGHNRPINKVAFSPDGGLVLTADVAGAGGVWDPESGDPKKSLPPDWDLPNAPITMSKSGNLALFGQDFHGDVTGYILDTRSNRVTTIPFWSPDTVATAVFDPDEKIVIGYKDDGGDLSVVDVRSGEEIRQLDGASGRVQSLVMSPNGKRLATTGANAFAQLWDLDKGTVVAELRHLDEVKSVAFSPGGKFVVTASKDGSASVWDGLTGSLVTRLTGTGPLNSAVFDPTGAYILTTADKTAYLWKAKRPGFWNEVSQDSPHSIRGHSDVITAAVFSPNGKWIATASRDRTAQLWDTSLLTANYIDAPGGPGEISVAVFRGHIKPLLAAAFSPDSNYLVTSSEDRTARVWNLRTLGEFAIDSLSVSAEPDRYSGKCPATLKFTGRISVTGRNGTVKYKFVSRETSSSLPQDLVFDGPGTQQVTLTRDVSTSGWVELQIVEPVALRSNRAVFQITCSQNAIPGSITAAQLQEILPNASRETRARYLPYLQAAMKEYGIDTPQRRAAFLAEVAFNTIDLKVLEEIGSDESLEQKYGNRKDLGNSDPGDGARYKGRGGFLILGRSNYEALGEVLGVDLKTHPERLADPDVAFRAAALYWYRNGLNELADKDDLQTINRRISGGTSGLQAVKDYFDRAKLVFSR